jgi:Uma2 family endonuclease
MTMMVQTSTDEAPELLALIEHRRANGLDRYDEWWEGVYRIVTGPSPEHGEFVANLAAALIPKARTRGLGVSTPVNIGVDKYDAKVPDLGVFRRDTQRSSPAFLDTAELVVEVLSPGERAGEKLPFYAFRNVSEYLEVDLRQRSVRLLENVDGEWRDVRASGVIELSVDEVPALLPVS